jgi:predicted heme/steroid binding protein
LFLFLLIISLLKGKRIMKRYLTFFVLLLAVALFAVGCASGATAQSTGATAEATVAPVVTNTPAATTSSGAATGSAENGTLELTLAELAKYNGKDGNPAYVAVDGVIYDVSGYAKWKNGDHNGYTAGNDLTDIIKNKSPHGVAKLKGVPVVGKLIAG